MSKGFISTRRGNPCKACGDTTGKCREADSTLLCMSFTDACITVPGLKYIGLTKNGLWGKWVEDQGQEWSDTQREQWRQERQRLKEQRNREESQRQAASLPAVERDRYNQQLLNQLSLHPSDRADLLRRGLSDAQIRSWGVKSVGRWQKLEQYLPHTLPGVNLMGDGLNVSHAGYLCPIRDVDGLLVGFQLRLRAAESGGRYRWLTSATKTRWHGPTSHLPNGELPLAVHRPDQVSCQAIALVEGTGPKPLILCQRRGQVVAGAAGGQFASSPQSLQYTLAVLSAELGTKEVEFYPDAGAITNRNVMRQHRRTWKLLRKLGYSVQVAWWGQVTKAAPDIDELDDFTTIAWLTTAQFEALSYRCLGRLERIKQRLKRALKPTASAAALCREPEGPDQAVIEYAAGDRLSTWQQAIEQGYRFILDQTATGGGKSFDAGMVVPSSLRASQVIYVSDQHRNPTVETLDTAHGWVDLEARHAGLVREVTPGGNRRLKRAASGETPSISANCNRTGVISTLRSKHVNGADTAALICGTCPLREACTHAEGPGYGFLNQRHSTLSSPKLRSHPDSLPNPQDYEYDSVALIWDEPGQSLVTKRDVQVSLTDLEQTITALLPYSELFEQVQTLATNLLPYLNGKKKLGRFGLNHTEVMQQLPVPAVNIQKLEQALQPDLAFLNTTAVYGQDLEDLPAYLRKRFSKRDGAMAEQAQQRVLKQWLPDLLRVLTGCLNGAVRLEKRVLTLSLPDTRHQAIAHAAGTVVFLDATLSRQDLALKLKCNPEDIFVCRQKNEEHGNLTLIQVMDLGWMGMQQGADQKRRAQAVVDYYKALDPETKVINFKRFAKDGEGVWWRDSRGVNDFTKVKTLILAGTPCRNLADLRAEYAVLTGVQNPEDLGVKAFVDRSIQADVQQAIGRLRAHRRPEEKLQVIILSNFALKIPTQQMKAADITLEAAGREERLLLAAKAAVDTLRQRGEKVTQTAVAAITKCSQQRISQIWRLLVLLLENSNSNASKNSSADVRLDQPTPLQSERGMEAELLPNPDSDCRLSASLRSSGEPDPDSIEVEMIDSVSQVIKTLIEQECDEDSLLESLQEVFFEWLQPRQWLEVWHLLSVGEQIRVLSVLLTTLPRNIFTPLDNKTSFFEETLLL